MNIQKCVENFKAKIGRKQTFGNCMNKLKESVEHTMKKSKVQKLGGKRQTLKAAPWVDKELTDSISLRSSYSRDWRKARKKGDVEEIERCKKKYYQQKNVTAVMVGNKKSGWEEEKIAETEGNSEAFWKMVKVLLGRGKEDKEEVYIFDGEGEKKEILECKGEFMKEWSTQVYQKLSKADFSFW